MLPHRPLTSNVSFLNTGLKWNSYIRTIVKDAVIEIDLFYRSRKYLTPIAMLYVYKSQIKPDLEYCYQIWTASVPAVQKWVQKRSSGDKLFPFNVFPRDEILLTPRYFLGKCSDELHSFVLTIQIPTARTLHGTYSESTLNYSLRIPFVRKKFLSDSLFLHQRLYACICLG